MNSIRELVSLTNIIITLIILSLPAIQLAPPGSTEYHKEDILSSDITDPVDPRYNLEITTPDIIKDDPKSVQKSLKQLENNLNKGQIVLQTEQSVAPNVKIDQNNQSRKVTEDKKGAALSNSKTVDESEVPSVNPTISKQNEQKISEVDTHDQTFDNYGNKGDQVEIERVNDGSEASTTTNIIQTTEKPASDTIGTNEDKIGSNLGKEENSEPKGLKTQQLPNQSKDTDKKDKLPPVVDSQMQNPKLIDTKAQLARNQSQEKNTPVIHSNDTMKNDRHNAKAQIPQNTEANVPIPKDMDAYAQDKPKPESKTENPPVEASKTAVEASKTEVETKKTADKTTKSTNKDSNSEDKALVSQKTSKDKDTSNEPKNVAVEIPKEELKKETAEQNPVAETKDDSIGIDNPPVDDSGDKTDTKALLPKEDGEGSISAQNNIDELDSRTDGPGPTNYDGNEDGEKVDDKEGTGVDSNTNDNAEKMKNLQSASDASLNFPEQEDNHFFAYFVTAVVIFAIGYLLIHNKQKILGLIVEGRGGRRRRRSHVYKRLETDGSKFGQIF